MPIGFFQTIQDSPTFHRFTFGVSAMPIWARAILLIPLLPGILLVSLSLLAVIVSLIALLLLTAPVYLLLKWITGVKATPATGFTSRGAKRVEAKVTDA